jgi:aminopeptidase N
MGMFDAHSYQKGGLTLHLLRNYAGDSAFFTSIRTYLIQNAYQSADIDHLRHAFEKVTGLDWTWFFDQHFRRGDEVRLLITAEAQGDTAQIKILQRGYDEKLGPYRYLLPLEVASREKGVERLPMELVGDTLIKVARRGLLYVDYDPERLFVGSSDRRYPNSWREALLQAPSYLARVEALSQIASLGYQMHEPQTMQRVLATYEGASVAWQVRVWEALESLYDTVAIQSVIPLAQRAIRSQEAKVRAAAWSWIAALARQFASPVFGKEETFVPTAPLVLKATFWQPEAEKALQDSSAEVISTALLMLYYADEARAKEAALRFLTHPSEEVFIGAISILMRQKAPEGIQGLLSRQACLAGLEARSTTISLLLQAITLYPDHRETILTALKKIAKYENPWYLRLIAVRGLRRSISLDPTIRPFLKELKKSETHPILRKVYEQEL